MSNSEFENKRQIDAICHEFEARWATDGKNAIQSLLDRVDSKSRQDLLERLLAIDVELRMQDDQSLSANYYRDLGEDAIRYVEGLLRANPPTRSTANEDATRDITGQPEDSHDTLTSDFQPPESEPPTFVGRYRIESVLGKGGFGLVYKAYDDQLQRHVAVKVPHAHLVNDQADAEAYLNEA